MKYSDLIWNEFIFGGHWGSIAASAIALSTLILLDMEVRWEFLLIVYLGTQCIYNYNHYKEIEIDEVNNLPRTNHLKKYCKYLPLLTAFYGIVYFTILIYFGNKPSVFFGGFLLLIGLLFTYEGKKVSKKIEGFKSVYAAFSWGLLTFFTAIYHSYPIEVSVIILFAFVFLRLMIDTSFFDIKDMKSDRKKGLLTLPMIFNNKQNWLNFLHLLNLMSFMPIIFGVLMQILPLFSLFLLFLFFYSFYYIQKAKSEKADIHSLSYIIADGEYYYWPFLLYIGLILTV